MIRKKPEDFLFPPTGGLRNYRMGYQDGLTRGKEELTEILGKISAEIEEKMSHYDHFENSNTANGLRIAKEIVEKYKKEVRE